MPHTYSACLVHCVFSTKERRNIITPEMRGRLFAYMAGVARGNGIGAVAVGGTRNHVHLLLDVPPTVNASKAMQLIKGRSSRWIHETFPSQAGFEWQEAYGAFSIGTSQVARTVDYIERQEEHHASRPFEDEFLAILRKHKIDHDPQHAWG